MFVNIVLVLVAFGVLALTVTVILHLFLPVPYVPTPRVVIDRMVELAKLRGDEVVLDLGAGDGRILITAKKKYPGLRARGYEVVPTIWLLGKIRSWWSGVEVDLKLGSIERANTREADAIFLYLIPSLMKKLERKFDGELKKGTRVISSGFAFPAKQPLHSEVYQGKKLFVYEW